MDDAATKSDLDFINDAGVLSDDNADHLQDDDEDAGSEVDNEEAMDVDQVDEEYVPTQWSESDDDHIAIQRPKTVSFAPF